MAPAIIVLIGAVIGAIVAFGPAALENTSSAGSAGRVPVPGSATITLQARKYAIWYGVDNAPLNYQIHLPPLTFDIKSPSGVADPAFTESHGSESDTNGLAIRRAAYLRPSVAGNYVISVRSDNGPGGVILFGAALGQQAVSPTPGLLVLAASVLLAAFTFWLLSRQTRAKPIAADQH